MTALNKQALLRAAVKIGAEKWTHDGNGEVTTEEYMADGQALVDLICNCEVVGTSSPRAEFIALANPAAILVLLDENLQLQRDKDSLEAIALAMRDDMRDAREKQEAAERRNAELEARTVVVKQFDDFQIVHYGGSEDYAKGYIDCQNNYNKALAAAGIGVKGE